MGRLVVLSGKPGSGKTMGCRRLADEVRRRGLTVGGLLSLPTPAGRAGAPAQPAERLLEDLGSGERRPLARRVPPESREPGDPLWRLSDETLAWGDAVLAGACPADVLIIDEVGPVELLHRRGWHDGLWRALAGRYRLAVVVVRPWLMPRFRELWREPIELVIDVAGIDPRALADDLLAVVCAPAAGGPVDSDGEVDL